MKPAEYLKVWSGILFHPLKTLDERKAEAGIRESLWFIVISAIITGAIAFAIQSVLGTKLTSAAFSGGSFILGYILLTFLFSGIFHGMVLLFRGKNPYYQTFKAIAYVSGLSIIGTIITGLTAVFTPFLIVSFLFNVWVFILLTSGLKHYTELDNWKLAIIWAILIGVVIGAAFWMAKYIGTGF